MGNIKHIVVCVNYDGQIRWVAFRVLAPLGLPHIRIKKFSDFSLTYTEQKFTVLKSHLSITRFSHTYFSFLSRCSICFLMPLLLLPCRM